MKQEGFWQEKQTVSHEEVLTHEEMLSYEKYCRMTRKFKMICLLSCKTRKAGAF